MDQANENHPIVLITGAAGNIGRSVAAALADRYRIVGLDVEAADADYPILEMDITDDRSVAATLASFRERYGDKIAAVLHLAAFFDFTGEEKPAYQAVNVDGSRRLVAALRDFDVGAFVYSGTMLVHKAGEAGQTIDEDREIAPGWAYPRSKARAEAAIGEVRGDMPVIFLHLAGLYDERSSVPTFAHQMARIYERDLQSHFYSGDLCAGQAMIHRDDMVDAMVRAVDRRNRFSAETTILIGEPETLGYGEVQDRLGRLIHGEAAWATLRIPAPLAAAGAWAQNRAEPVVPEPIDRGEPFIKPFMTRLASDHYQLDISRAHTLLKWEPQHRLADVLPAMVAAMKDDPAAWYAANGITPPASLAHSNRVEADAGPGR
ncbi:NAD(P)-dependent oxidoreductase [Stakelama sp. CBK3Z-3]|uniref:NAD(P)-dependent oxidoreductase n=1 Tax=Stakelama flava TaxID=2860338 RepID=A0ABS6XM80_9SPHN|nr:NAD(P)-dependent oxidoreductase [Stakelama flava]MBW4331009.1 NAD(P)-dependent oxidoreductase [Stakelama flava]